MIEILIDDENRNGSKKEPRVEKNEINPRPE